MTDKKTDEAERAEAAKEVEAPSGTRHLMQEEMERKARAGAPANKAKKGPNDDEADDEADDKVLRSGVGSKGR